MGKTKQNKANSGQSVAEVKQASYVVGEIVKIQKDYLDMKDVPDEDGLPHAGYLVLKKNEAVTILYAGSDKTGDSGWLFGDVSKSLPPSGAGRRGWFPATALESVPPPPPPPAPAARAEIQPTPSPATSVSSSTVGRTQDAELQRSLGIASKGSTGPGPPLEGYTAVKPKQSQAQPRQGQARPLLQPETRKPLIQKASAVDTSDRSPPAHTTLAAAFDVAATGAVGSSGKRGKNHSAVKSKIGQPPNSDFPALPGHSGTAWWDEIEEEEEPPPPPPPAKPSKALPKQNAAEVIARNRASADAAAAEAKAKEAKSARGKGGKSKANDATCPICMESYRDGQRRLAQLPCCGVEMCSQCSEKSLRSRRCYFCREEADAFPSLAASAGSSVQAY